MRECGFYQGECEEMSVSERNPHGATKIKSSGDGGGGGKWLLGAAAAVVLLGGGYMAWNAMSPNQNNQSAYNAPYADTYAGPLDAAPGAGDDYASPAEDSTAAPAAAAPAPRSTPAPRRTTTAQAEPIPEATIGISPANATTEYASDEDIVVSAPRRPVWSQTPNARTLTAMYPNQALRNGREGEASLSCIVLEGGALDCQRVSETSGFGPAALRVAQSFRHAPQRADGADAVGTPLNLRVVFRINEVPQQHGTRLRS